MSDISSDSADTFLDEISNPLDGVEDVLTNQNWAFTRANRDELFVEVKGRHGIYNMMFAWDEEFGALQFCCEYDLQLHDLHINKAYRTIAHINRSLWLGHFDLSEETMKPSFRHTQLFRGMTQTSGADHLHDLMQIAVDECDRHYQTLLMLSHSDAGDEASLSLAMMTVAGRS